MTAYHHGNLRETLLLEARKQLEDIGSEKLSLRALARSIGVSQTAPYRHFSDKETLLGAMATEAFRELQMHLKQVAEGCPDLDTAMVEVGVGYVNFAVENRALYKLMFGPALARKDSCPLLKEAAEGCLGELKNLIQQRMNIPDSDELWYLTINAAALIKGHTSMVLEGINNCHPDTGEDFDLRKALRLFLNPLKSC